MSSLFDTMAVLPPAISVAEAEAFARCAARPDFDEGVNAFFEKRKARFNG